MSARAMSPESTHSAPVAQFPAHDHAGHSVQFYKDDSVMLANLSQFVGAALMAGNSAVVVATQAHRDGLARLLGSRGLNVADAKAQGRYIVMDAAETLSKFMVESQLNRALFNEVIGPVILKAKSAVQGKHSSVAVFGEMVALLWAERKVDTAIQLEQLWNDLAKSLEFSLFCAYPMDSFCREEDAKLFERICDAHTLVIPSESYTTLAYDEQRLRSIADLQQKAEALNSRVALHESEERFRHLVE